MRFNHAPEVMPDRHNSMPIVPNDVMILIQRVALAIAHGLDLNDTVSVEALARQLETDLVPRIVPDRRYALRELEEKFGYKHSTFYRRRGHLIRKDGRASYILGRELLADLEATPRLVSGDGAHVLKTLPPRQRGRPRKSRDPGST